MSVRRALPWFAVVVILLPATPARSGGWDSLTFPGRQDVVGDVASARSQFLAGELEGTGSPDDGPYPLGREPVPTATPSVLRGPAPPRVALARESSVTWWIALLAAGLGLSAGVAIGRRRPRGHSVAVPTRSRTT